MYKDLLQNQRNFFASGQTQSYEFRITQLKKIHTLIQTYESDISNALKQDLNKSPMEAYLSEIHLLRDEIKFILKNLSRWMKPVKTKTPFPFLWPGASKLYNEPYGTVLIISPWNYPFMLALSPLVGAISAGNCAIVKPSEISTHTEELIIKIINDNFAPEFIQAIKANGAETQKLLEEKFDYLFFTGNTAIGKHIMSAAAKHLTPLTLELGGKSPCIIDETANFNFAARRIVWAKFMNAGQTCIAPDFLYVQSNSKDKLVTALIQAIKQFYGENAAVSESYGRIINKKHFLRLNQLMEKTHVLYGGEIDATNRYIAPTLLDQIDWTSPIMQEEIFGPLLPIMTFDHIDEVIAEMQRQPKSLALYVFSQNKTIQNKILKQLSFGGGCINDCMLHLANLNLPFGGVGPSGMGRYHGKFSFDTFSHQKAIYQKQFAFESQLEYPPYSPKKWRWVKRILQLI